MFIVIFEIHQLYLIFSRDNQCSSSLNASHSLEWIHQSHSLKSKQTALSMTFIADIYINSGLLLPFSFSLIIMTLYCCL